MDVLTANVEVPEPVTDVGAKDAEVPEGRPLMDKPTTSERPFSAVMDTVY